MRDKERVKLEAEIARLRAENAQLREELQAVLERLKELEGKSPQPTSFVKANRPK